MFVPLTCNSCHSVLCLVQNNLYPFRLSYIWFLLVYEKVLVFCFSLRAMLIGFDLISTVDCQFVKL